MLLETLPPAPTPGEPSFTLHVRDGLRDLRRRYPIGQVVVEGDIAVIDALDVVDDLPAAIWLRPGSSTEVVRHFQSWTAGIQYGGEPADVQTAPNLPSARGSCPVLVVLGRAVGSTCYLHRTSLQLLDIFSSTTLGLTMLIDPTAGDLKPPWAFKGIWDRRFDAIYRPTATLDHQTS